MSGASLPSRCPACGAGLEVVRLRCPACATEVQGSFRPCPVCQLDAGARGLFELFLAARGNLKHVQRALGVSYPTVRQRIEELFEKLGLETGAPEPMAVLRRLRAGEISLADAEELLRG